MKNIEFIETKVKMPLMELPVRTAIVTLDSGAVLMFSPGSKIDLETYKKHPGITDIIAPNLFHCGGVQKAAQAYPQARIWGPPKAKKKYPELNWTHELSIEQWPYSKELELLPIKGQPKVNEFLFFHLASKSLIVCDLCFNMVGIKGFGPRIILGVFGTYNRFAISRFFLSAVVDRSAFIESMKAVCAKPFENIIINHGNNISGNGQSLLKQALSERGFTLN